MDQVEVEVHRFDVKILTSVVSILWIVDVSLFFLLWWEGNKALKFMFPMELFKLPDLIDLIKPTSFRKDKSTSLLRQAKNLSPLISTLDSWAR